MDPRIKSGHLIMLHPASGVRVRQGDVVLAQVRGRYYLHSVSRISMVKGMPKFEISNNHGHCNGWTTRERIFGHVPDV